MSFPTRATRDPFPSAGDTVRLVAAVLFAALVAVAGCSRVDRGTAAAAENHGPAAELRLGYLPNVTHAAALIGLDKGLFARELGNGTKLVPTSFNAGPEAVGALLGGSLDATFVGPGPAINAYTRSDGEAVRLIAGATSGGAQLVVRAGIVKPADLAGTTVATPQLGNTQDVSLKKWLSEQRLTDKVEVANLQNAQTLDAFKKGDVDGAWLPEPWSSQLVLDAGATVLVDEQQLWPRGRFPTTVLIVRTAFLREHPQTVRALLTGLLAATEYAKSDPSGAKTATNAQLKARTGKELTQAVLDRAFGNITLTVDPVAGAFPQLAEDAVTAGIADKAAEVAGYADLSALNEVLGQAGRPTVDAGGLDAK